MTQIRSNTINFNLDFTTMRLLQKNKDIFSRRNEVKNEEKTQKTRTKTGKMKHDSYMNK